MIIVRILVAPSLQQSAVSKPAAQTVTTPGKLITTPGKTITTPGRQDSSAKTGKQRRTGPLALFLRKVYSLAHIRLETLCNSMQV